MPLTYKECVGRAKLNTLSQLTVGTRLLHKSHSRGPIECTTYNQHPPCHQNMSIEPANLLDNEKAHGQA